MRIPLSLQCRDALQGGSANYDTFEGGFRAPALEEGAHDNSRLARGLEPGRPRRLLTAPDDARTAGCLLAQTKGRLAIAAQRSAARSGSLRRRPLCRSNSIGG